MTTPQAPSQEETPLYGGFRRGHSFGVGSLTGPQTVVLLACVLVPVLSVAAGAPLSSLLASVPVALTVMALTVAQRHGMPLLSLAGALLRWQVADWRGETTWRGVYLPYPAGLDLPGVAAPTKLLRVEDSTTGRRVGLVWNQRSGRMAGTLLLSPAGTLLAPPRTITAQVRAWGEALGRLADEATITAASVTIQVTPSSGAALSTHVRGRTDPGAPRLAKATTQALVDSAPAASAQMAAWFTVTVDPRRAPDPATTPEEGAAETLRTLDSIDLSGAGADVLRRATDDDLKRIVRGAFVLSDADAPAEEIAALTWDECGPTAADDRPTVYRHDGPGDSGGEYLSSTWVLRAAPRKHVPYDVLLRLLSPGRYPRRITLAYKVLPTEQAAALVEREQSAAMAREEARRYSRRTPTMRDRVDKANAERAGAEEARGAGVAQWSVWVTTTVTRPEDLPAAQREVHKAAQQAGGLKFRPAFGAQSAAFVAGLPLGVNPLG